MTDAVYLLLAECVRGKQAEDFVFTRRKGKRVRDFPITLDKVWPRAAAQPGNDYGVRSPPSRNEAERGAGAR